MAVTLCPTFGVGYQSFNAGGLPNNAGLIYTYAAGTVTPLATYTTYLGNVQNANPIVLGADGRPPQEIWITIGVSYLFVVQDSLGNTLGSYDNISYAALITALSSTPPFVDSTPIIKGSGDPTKLFAIEVDGFTTGTTRTLTPPNANLTLPNPTTTGDIPIASAAGVLTVLPVGAAGSIAISRAASTLKVAYVTPLSSLINGNLWSVNAGDATNSTDIAAGGCMDSTGVYWMDGTAITKAVNTAWAVGTNQGGLDTGAVGNSDYYIWRIARSDTGVVDALYSLSSTAPTMPANYDYKRLIGWIKRLAGANVAYHTYATGGGSVELIWDSPTLDIDLSNTLTTARRTDAVKVPLNFSTTAHLNVRMSDASAVFAAWVYCPDQTDLAPSGTAAPLANTFDSTSAGGTFSQQRVRTSSAGLIAARATLATVDSYRVSTMGFTWGRSI
jgi:hypothetical protein